MGIRAEPKANMPAATTSSLPSILALARCRFRPMTNPHRALRYLGAVSWRPSHPGHEADEENQGHGRQDQRHAQVALFLFGGHGLGVLNQSRGLRWHRAWAEWQRCGTGLATGPPIPDLRHRPMAWRGLFPPCHAAQERPPPRRNTPAPDQNRNRPRWQLR